MASNSTQPTGPAHPLQISYDYNNWVGANLTNGTSITFNSWVSIPTGKSAGLYNNTIHFCATKEGTKNC